MNRDSGESVYLVGLELPGRGIWSPPDSLAELRELAESAGARVCGQTLLRVRRPNPALLIGTGQAGEVVAEAARLKAQAIVFDAELQPRQQRNLERRARRKILDRTALILDVFARHAGSAEGKLQVARAQIDYLLPRLSDLWVQFSRTGGGIGTRGPGETQIERDRRELRARLSVLDRQIERIRARRSIARAQRAEAGLTVALVGYTNAGKTSLHAALSGSTDSGEARMFATLDPKVRRSVLPGGQLALLIDTVGFINRLPPRLVTAFRATLEEIDAADAIVHVADVAAPHLAERVETVVATLEDMGLADKPTVLALNKCDRLPAAADAPLPGGVLVSARTGAGLDELQAAIGNVATADWRQFAVRIPFRQTALIEEIKAGGRIVTLEYRGDLVLVRGSGPPALLDRLGRYAEPAPSSP